MSTIRSIAEIEKDNARLAKLRASNKVVEERYTHTVLDDEGIEVDSATAIQILSAVKPEYMTTECDRYYFVNDKHGAALVGVDWENTGVFTAEMPREMADVVDDPLNLNASVQYFKSQEQLFKEVRVKGYQVMALGIAAIIVVMLITVMYGRAAGLIVFGALLLCIGLAFRG